MSATFPEMRNVALVVRGDAIYRFGHRLEQRQSPHVARVLPPAGDPPRVRGRVGDVDGRPSMIRLTKVNDYKSRWVNPRYIVWMEPENHAIVNGVTIVMIDGDVEPMLVRESIDDILMQGSQPDPVAVFPNPVSVR
jgi:uncharacterized protein YlzI (FlbEa/FlbD family)